ncbi:hypothetical protein FDP41_004732 [Naegleria fowleri]|uniref:Protein kinase domain-containing protein n=1 Tax=Naegleria fowleri TaxID=5763 RepID=A0A6A5BMB2_NAEFO|nr:uncharacterized protein FDP41_004732 [Naegleria fowleri]KAF0976056.1 hypothetical protein FDP41_004732 [Naegleria fowleri]CAG4717047.1 unnamed protein product [Naegleria fowleri]
MSSNNSTLDNLPSLPENENDSEYFNIWRSRIFTKISDLVLAYRNTKSEQDLENLSNFFFETVETYLYKIKEKTPQNSFFMLTFFDNLRQSNDTLPILMTEKCARYYREVIANPEFGANKSEQRNEHWSLLSIFQDLSSFPEEFVKCGYLQLMIDMNMVERFFHQRNIMFQLMQIFQKIGSLPEYSHLVITYMIQVLKAIDPNSHDFKTMLTWIQNIVNLNRDLLNQFPNEFAWLKDCFYSTRIRAVKDLLINIFGDIYESEFVSFFVEYAGTKKKFSYLISKQIEPTVEDIARFILEKCVDDVDCVTKYELEFYDEDIEDYVEFEFADPQIFQKQGAVAKFKLKTTIDQTKAKPKQPVVNQSLSERSNIPLSEKPSLIDISEKDLVSDHDVNNVNIQMSNMDMSGIELSALEMSTQEKPQQKPTQPSAHQDSGIQLSNMSGIEMSGIVMQSEISGIQMSGLGQDMSAFSQFNSDHQQGTGQLDMPSFMSTNEIQNNNHSHNSMMDSVMGGNSLLSENFDIADSIKEPAIIPQKEKASNKIVNETYKLQHRIDSKDSNKKVFTAKDLANKSAPPLVIKYLPIRSTLEFNRCMKEGVQMIRTGRIILQKKIPLANVFDVFEEEYKESNKASIRYMCFAMPYYEKGNLQDFIQKHHFIMNSTLVISILQQITSAIHFLHSQKTAHKNIKLSNIFIQELTPPQNGQGGSIVLALTDYGISQDLSNSIVPEFKVLQDFSSDVSLERYQRADIWQAGLVFTQIVCCLSNPSAALTLHSVNDVIEKSGAAALDSLLLSNNSLLLDLSSRLPSLKTLLTKMLHVEPNERPSAQEVLSNLSDL